MFVQNVTHSIPASKKCLILVEELRSSKTVLVHLVLLSRQQKKRLPKVEEAVAEETTEEVLEVVTEAAEETPTETEEVIEETVTEEVSEDSEPTEEESNPEEVKD